MSGVSKEAVNIQKEVREQIEVIRHLLLQFSQSDSCNLHGKLEASFKKLVQSTWHALPQSDPQGSALATASCIPLWGLLNFYTSAVSPLAAEKRAFVTQMLTAMYPKPKDRRCIFQQVNCCGRDSASSVPLSTTLRIMDTPVEFSESVAPTALKYRTCVLFVANSVVLEETLSRPKGESLAQEKTRLFLEILPHCVIGEASEGMTPQVVHVKVSDTSNSLFSWRTFALTVWKYLIMAHIHCPAQKEAIVSFLTKSFWSTKLFVHGEARVAYNTVTSPLVNRINACLSINPQKASVAADNDPLAAPGAIPLMGAPLGVLRADETTTELSGPFSADPVATVEAPEMQMESDRVAERLLSKIQSEVDFFGSSPTCRDADQLVMLSRSLLFCPTSRASAASGLSSDKLDMILFDRKRGRDWDSCEGPLFLPHTSCGADLLDKGNNNASESTLERLASRWN